MIDLTDWQNKKYTRKDGIEVRILCIDAPGPYPVVGIVMYGDIHIVAEWDLEGKYRFCDTDKNTWLINAKTKHDGYIVLTKDGQYPVLGVNIYSTEKELLTRFPHAIPAHIEWEE